jgi:hypothetical protein
VLAATTSGNRGSEIGCLKEAKLRMGSRWKGNMMVKEVKEIIQKSAILVIKTIFSSKGLEGPLISIGILTLKML